jgi:hypothetical protein
MEGRGRPLPTQCVRRFPGRENKKRRNHLMASAHANVKSWTMDHDIKNQTVEQRAKQDRLVSKYKQHRKERLEMVKAVEPPPLLLTPVRLSDLFLFLSLPLSLSRYLSILLSRSRLQCISIVPMPLVLSLSFPYIDPSSSLSLSSLIPLYRFFAGRCGQ